MRADISTFLALIWQTILEPRQVAQGIKDAKFGPDVLWTGFALVSVLSALLLSLVVYLVPEMLQVEALEIGPLNFTLIITVLLMATIVAILLAGQSISGQGEFPDALALIVWLQAVGVVLRAVQIPILLLVPNLGIVVSLLAMGVIVWCAVNFVNVLHGFHGVGRALFTLMLAFVGTIIGAGLILPLLGITPIGGPT